MEYKELLAALSGIAAFIITYFDKGEKKYELMKDMYFEKVLKEYHIRYVEDNKINSVRFIKKNYKKSDSYIPRYIFYLVDNNEKEKLKQVLLEDYFNYYPNFENSLSNTFNKLAGKVYIIELFAVSFAGVFITLLTLKEVYNLAIVVYDLTKGRTGTNNLNILGIVMPDWMSSVINIITMEIFSFISIALLNLMSAQRMIQEDGLVMTVKK